MSKLDELEALESYLDIQVEDLNMFIRRNSLKTHPSAYRAFKFGLKSVFFRCNIEDVEEGIQIKKVIDSHDFIQVFKSNLPLFLAFDMVKVKMNWVLMNMSKEKVYLLLKSEKTNGLEASIEKLKEALDLVSEQTGWKGNLFYKIIDAGGQNQIK